MPTRWYSQAEILDGLAYGDDPLPRKMFLDNGMDGRYLSLSPDQFGRTAEPGFQQHMFQRASVDLAESAVRELMERRQIAPGRVGTLISITSYGFAVPSISACLVERLGLRSDVTKLDLTGAGCLGGISLLHAAQRFANERPDGLVIAVSAEVGSVFMRPWPIEDRGKMVINALMGDAAAAVVLGAEDPRCEGETRPQIIDTQYASAPGTLDEVDIRVGPDGTMAGHIHRTVPQIAHALYPRAADSLYARHGIEARDIAHWALHPGSRLVIEAVQDALKLRDEQLATSRKILRSHGNVASATALLCLHERMNHPGVKAGDLGILGGIGPGMTVGLTLLRWS